MIPHSRCSTVLSGLRKSESLGPLPQVGPKTSDKSGYSLIYRGEIIPVKPSHFRPFVGAPGALHITGLRAQFVHQLTVFTQPAACDLENLAWPECGRPIVGHWPSDTP